MPKHILIITLMLTLTACASMQTKEKFSKFDSAQNLYAAAIRWARYMDAYDFHASRDGDKPALNTELYKGIEVTAYEVIEKTANEAFDEVRVVAMISYYNESYGTVHQYRHVQDWWYNVERKSWLLQGAMPTFR